jgi:hypothetical protein
VVGAAAEQIASALSKHKGKVSVIVPHFAMSGGTFIALSADEIIMDENAVLGPVDPQLGGFPAASIVRVLREKDKKDIEDKTIILADVFPEVGLECIIALYIELTTTNIDKVSVPRHYDVIESYACIVTTVSSPHICICGVLEIERITTEPVVLNSRARDVEGIEEPNDTIRKHE